MLHVHVKTMFVSNVLPVQSDKTCYKEHVHSFYTQDDNDSSYKTFTDTPCQPNMTTIVKDIRTIRRRIDKIGNNFHLIISEIIIT